MDNEKPYAVGLLSEEDFYRLLGRQYTEAAYLCQDILGDIQGSKVGTKQSLEGKKRRLKQIINNGYVLTLQNEEYKPDMQLISDFLADIYAMMKMPETGSKAVDGAILSIMKILGRSIAHDIEKEDVKSKEDLKSKDFHFHSPVVDEVWTRMGKIKEAPKFEDPDFHNKDMNDFWKAMLEDLKGDQNDESDSDKSGN